MYTSRILTALSAAFLLCFSLSSTTPAVDLTVQAVTNGVPSQMTTLSITANQIGFDPGGFDLLLLVDDSRSHFVTARAGDMLSACAWEYFTYRVYGPDSTDAYGPLPGTHFIRLTGIVATSAAYTPVCYGQPGAVELAQLDLLIADVSAASDVDCQFVPIRFFWRDCNDNVVWNSAGDTAHLAYEIGEYGVPGPLAYPFPGLGAPGNACVTLASRIVVADVSAVNGGVDMLCTDPLYLRGDINLNGIPYESGDLVMLALFFQYGMSVFVQNPQIQIANSDVNADGVVLTVADYVYLIRVIISDALALP